ncbi:MAG: solute carrier family 23 protein [Alphaproteobacteria bacterium]
MTSNASWCLPHWTVKRQGTILPEERLPAGQAIVAGLQHVVAMFGATSLVPLLIGFDPNVVIFFSGVATLIFFVITGGRVPSYLGSSFSFIAVVIAATGYVGPGPNSNLALALGGIVAAGAVYALIGTGVIVAGHAWIERLMPPVVTGAVVAVIGLNLAPIAVRNIAGTPFDTWTGLFTVVAVATIACFGKGILRRVPILLGGMLAYLVYAVLANGFGYGKPIEFSTIEAADWLGVPHFTAPVFEGRAMALIAPVAIVLVAENLGHIRAIGAMTGRDFNSYLGRAFLGDGIATMIAGASGGTGVTTYAENMGVMAVTHIFSTLNFVIAGLFAIALGFSPKFGAAISTIPIPVLGGLAIVVFGLISATAGRIWVENKVDFADVRNLVTTGVALTLGAGDLALKLGGFTLGGIGTATFGAIILHAVLRRGQGRDGSS